MDLLLQQICNGLVIGSTYAVVALGFALAFSVLRVVHFAHPDVFMIGMFSGLVAANYWPACTRRRAPSICTRNFRAASGAPGVSARGWSG